MLSSKTMLAHYYPKILVTLATDASIKGLVAVLSHKTANGEEIPKTYASRSHLTAERNYAQIEKSLRNYVWCEKVQSIFIFYWKR